MNTIPTKINRYNVYNKGNRLLGVGEEMTLPDFEPSSETVTGAGILGPHYSRDRKTPFVSLSGVLHRNQRASSSDKSDFSC